eukprot:TRINITY_DN6272_c0_g2_i1.p1 TRINITY_DN6272_c0_g2~~TRINITY_DN6272_c0_g2_i1.p1  ORF type:complete len:443 (+),score=129.71 TRINITY_DN6272_c0_g2_i1:72-1331(+)
MVIAVQHTPTSFRLAVVRETVPVGQDTVNILWLRCVNPPSGAPFPEDEDGLCEGVEVALLPDPSGFATFTQGGLGTVSRSRCMLQLMSCEHLMRTSLRGLKYLSIPNADFTNHVTANGRRFCSQKLYRQAVKEKAPGSRGVPGTLPYLLDSATATPVPAHVINHPFCDMVKYTVSELGLVKDSLRAREERDGVVLKGMIARQWIAKGVFLGEYVGTVYANEMAVKQAYPGSRVAEAAQVPTGAYTFSVQLRDDDVHNEDDTIAFFIDSQDPKTSSWVRHVNAAEFAPPAADLQTRKRKACASGGGGGVGAADSSSDLAVGAPPHCWQPGMQNCEFHQYDHRIFLRTIEVIPPGKELLASYGQDTADLVGMEGSGSSASSCQSASPAADDSSGVRRDPAEERERFKQLVMNRRGVVPLKK